MADRPIGLIDRIVANGVFLAGLWFAANGIWDLARTDNISIDTLFAPIMTVMAGGLFLLAAWRMRHAIRWRHDDAD